MLTIMELKTDFQLSPHFHNKLNWLHSAPYMTFKLAEGEASINIYCTNRHLI